MDRQVAEQDNRRNTGSCRYVAFIFKHEIGDMVEELNLNTNSATHKLGDSEPTALIFINNTGIIRH